MNKLAYINFGDAYWMTPSGRVFDTKDDTHSTFISSIFKISDNDENSSEGISKAIDNGWARIRVFGGDVQCDIKNVTVDFCRNLDLFIDRKVDETFNSIILRGVAKDSYYKISYSDYTDENYSTWECIKLHNSSRIAKIQNKLKHKLK
jgi:hypothetical protein